MDKVFAEQYPRKGPLIIFPEDRKLRQDIFLEKVEHPAKNNLYVLDAMVEYMTEPGAVILDPMAGGGSIMHCARLNRTITLIEIEEGFQKLLYTNMNGFTGKIIILEGDCRKLMPFPASFDSIIFSPPYANQLKANTGMAVYDPEKRGIAQGIVDFVTHPDNLSKMPDFWFIQAMDDVYAKCFASLKPGGTMGIIVKDRMKGGERVEFGLQQIRIANKAGFKLTDWFRREAIGKLFGNYNIKHGVAQVTDEHIIMFKKGE